MSEVRGHCRDCRFRRSEWVLADGKLILDRWCDIFDVFTPEDGYCHAFEEETPI